MLFKEELFTYIFIYTVSVNKIFSYIYISVNKIYRHIEAAILAVRTLHVMTYAVHIAAFSLPSEFWWLNGKSVSPEIKIKVAGSIPVWG